MNEVSRTSIRFVLVQSIKNAARISTHAESHLCCNRNANNPKTRRRETASRNCSPPGVGDKAAASTTLLQYLA